MQVIVERALTAAIHAELGTSFRLGDWNDIVALSTAERVELANALGMQYDGGNDTNFMCSRNGNRWNGSRHYFITRHDHNKPGYYAAHDHVDNHFISLGSWYGLSMRILAVLDL